jgi:hypothetical protein
MCASWHQALVMSGRHGKKSKQKSLPDKSDRPFFVLAHLARNIMKSDPERLQPVNLHSKLNVPQTAVQQRKTYLSYLRLM